MIPSDRPPGSGFMDFISGIGKKKDPTQSTGDKAKPSTSYEGDKKAAADQKTIHEKNPMIAAMQKQVSSFADKFKGSRSKVVPTLSRMLSDVIDGKTTNRKELRKIKDYLQEKAIFKKDTSRISYIMNQRTYDGWYHDRQIQEQIKVAKEIVNGLSPEDKKLLKELVDTLANRLVEKFGESDGIILTSDLDVRKFLADIADSLIPGVPGGAAGVSNQFLQFLLNNRKEIFK